MNHTDPLHPQHRVEETEVLLGPGSCPCLLAAPLVPLLGVGASLGTSPNGAPPPGPSGVTPLTSPCPFCFADVLGQRHVRPRALHPPGPLVPEALPTGLRSFCQPVTAGQLQAGPLEQPGLGRQSRGHNHCIMSPPSLLRFLHRLGT